VNSAQILEVPCLILAEVYNTTKTEQIQKKKPDKEWNLFTKFLSLFLFCFVALCWIVNFISLCIKHVYIIDKEIMQYKTSFDITMITTLTPVYPKCAW
jgi:uncharacterized membrane protein